MQRVHEQSVRAIFQSWVVPDSDRLGAEQAWELQKAEEALTAVEEELSDVIESEDLLRQRLTARWGDDDSPEFDEGLPERLKALSATRLKLEDRQAELAATIRSLRHRRGDPRRAGGSG